VRVRKTIKYVANERKSNDALVLIAKSSYREVSNDVHDYFLTDAYVLIVREPFY
jgi:hypothetical protein